MLQGTRTYGAAYDWGLKTSSSCYTKFTLSFAYGRYSLCCRVLAHTAWRMTEDSRQVGLVIQKLLSPLLKAGTVSAAGYSHIRRGLWLRTQDKFVLLYKNYSLLLRADTVCAAGYSLIRLGVWLRTQDNFALLWKNYSLVCLRQIGSLLQGVRSYGAAYDWGLKTSSSCYAKIILLFAYGRYSLCCRALAHTALRMTEDWRQVRLVQKLLSRLFKAGIVSAAGYSLIRRDVWLRTQDKLALLKKD